jgi:hypothetical protein
MHTNRAKMSVNVSTQTRNIPVLEMGGPFPVMVPVPEVGNHISGTALTVRFFRFLARAHVSHKQRERERRHALHLKLEKRRKWDHAHRCQFQYGTLKMTVPELAEPGTGNGTTHIDASSST